MTHEHLPLASLIETVDAELQRLNYSETCIVGFRCRWRELLKYAREKGEEFFTVALGEKFLLERYGIDVCKGNMEQDVPYHRVKAYKRHIFILADYQATGAVLRKSRTKRVEIPSAFIEPVEHYTAACRSRYNSEATIAARIYTVKAFLLYLEQKHINEIDAIDGNHISGFTETIIGQSQRTIGGRLATLRHFFQFLYQEQYHPRDLSGATPTVNCGRTAKLPQIWTAEQVERVLNAVDRGTAEGKRDYAILLLVTYSGLRDGDVQNLKFENLIWSECCIRLNQTKTGQPPELPLVEEIGTAIIDYLKFGRPKQDDSSYVFVRHKAPYGKCYNYYHVMKKYLGEAQIRLDTERLHGLHTLRHTLATRLLEQKVPLGTISQILGHTSINTTNIYLKVDISSLRECALNPEEVFVNA